MGFLAKIAFSGFLGIMGVVNCVEGVQQSITGNMTSYLNACSKAVEDSDYFRNFRSRHEYASILGEWGHANEYAHYFLTHASEEALSQLELFKRLDQYGSPSTCNFPGLEGFSPINIRYMYIADHLARLFQLPSHPKIGEIGAGFGGQCYILSHRIPFSSYFIYDLPEAERLTEKILKLLSVDRVNLLLLETPFPEDKIDLLISNYAFSECGRETQLDYFDRIIRKADRGYMLFNQLRCMDTLSPDEFVQLLNDQGMNASIHQEPVNTHSDNVLIVWDRTR